MVKRSSHIQLAVPRGGLAVLCPTCPIPGVNIPDNWMEHPLACVLFLNLSLFGSQFVCEANPHGEKAA